MSKKKKKEQKQLLPYVGETAEHYLASDNAKLAGELGELTDLLDKHSIMAVFDFRNARYADRDRHTVNRLFFCALDMSQTIRRLEFLLRNHLSRVDGYGAPVGSTGSAEGDFDKLLELTANAAYVVGVLQGAKLEGASPDRLEHIKSFAAL